MFFFDKSEEYWSDLENHLALINEGEFDQSAVSHGEEEAIFAFNLLKKNVVKWADSINLGYLSNYKKPLVANFHDDLFINFTYTNTMEIVSDVRSANDLHIHGDAAMINLLGAKNEKIVLGHGEQCARCLGIADTESYRKYVEETKKNPKEIFQERADIISTIELAKPSIGRVCVVGCSYSLVDYPYFPLILNLFSKNIEITLFSHSTTKPDWLDYYKNELRNLGYSNIKTPHNVPGWLQKKVF